MLFRLKIKDFAHEHSSLNYITNSKNISNHIQNLFNINTLIFLPTLQNKSFILHHSPFTIHRNHRLQLFFRLKIKDFAHEHSSLNYITNSKNISNHIQNLFNNNTLIFLLTLLQNKLFIIHYSPFTIHCNRRLQLNLLYKIIKNGKYIIIDL